MIIVPFHKDHFANLVAQPQQAFLKPLLMKPDYGAELALHYSRTGIIDGRVVACAGIYPLWEGCARAWVIAARDIGGAGFIALHRAVKRVLDERPERRIEAEVDTEFSQGHRWVKMLGGFEWEGTMRKYSLNGRDTDRYARVK